MENIIQSVSIKNFKSIKELDFECKKVNVFIGKPNVGKSNILEALSLFAFPIANSFDINKFLRLKTMKNLFNDNITKQNIEVKLKGGVVDFQAAYIIEHNPFHYEFYIGDPGYPNELQIIRNDGAPNGRYQIPNELLPKLKARFFLKQDGTGDPTTSTVAQYDILIRNYQFANNINFSQNFRPFLLPPDGRNLATILQDNNNLFNEIQGFFEEYGFELLVDVDKNEFEIQKRVEKRVYKYPFELMADTLQRIIFYLAAIESNSSAAIIFEEPETHSFPPYISTIARRINMDQTNQFFISTHSPYLLNTLIEETNFDNLNVFITYFENYQTKLRALENEELREILDDSIDAFFNLDRFISTLK